MESAEERKERLKELRQRAAASDAQEEEAQQPTSVEDNASGVVLKFRNYNVRDQKQIAHETISPAQPPQYEEPKAEVIKVEGAVQEEVLKVVAEGKKANWDLKRDLEKSLAKLERRTQRALIELAQQEQMNAQV